MPDSKEANVGEEQAAVTVQSSFRGFQARNEAKSKLLFETWSKIDLKEESELRGDVSMNNQIINNLKEKELKKMMPPSPDPEKQKEFQRDVLAKLDKLEHERKEEARALKEEHTVCNELSILTYDTLLDEDWVTDMMDAFRAGHILQKQSLLQITKRMVPVLAALPNISEISVPEHGRLTMVGDLHGQLDDLFSIFRLNGLPSFETPYLFNGDWVDRGPHSCEVVATIFAFKLLYPAAVHLNRGNHEARDINTRDGFEKECLHKYDPSVFDAFEGTFKYLPLAAIIEQAVFVVHAGLFYDDMLLPTIREFDRVHEVPPPETLMEDMLWSDPCAQNGKYDNSRGCALEFGPDVVDKFLTENNLQKIMRSHECVSEGFEEWFNGKLVTVFSASNYTGTVGNFGAFAIFLKHDVCNPKYVPFMAQKAHSMKRLNMRHGLLAEDIVIKLLMRITGNRLALINHYMNVSVGDSNIITRKQWSDGLVKVLQLRIPFNHFEEYLGLPQLGIDGTRGGPIDFMAFLHRFKPQHSALHDPTHEHNENVNQAFEDISQIIFSKRFALESVFRYFDSNGDGNVSHDEFTEGINSLTAIFGREYDDNVICEMIRRIDVNGDGMIEYSEFFDCFQTMDPSLLNPERIKNATAATKTSNMPHYKDHEDEGDAETAAADK